MTAYFILFCTSSAFIALRAFQQLNVQHNRYLWVPPVTACMALVEVLSITSVVKLGSLWAAVPMAAGGVVGCWFAMWLHQRLRKEKT